MVNRHCHTLRQRGWHQDRGLWGSLKDNIAGAATQVMVNDATGVLQDGVGDVKDAQRWGEGSVPGALLHGGVGGLASLAKDGDFAAGFVTSAGPEFTTGFVHGQTGGEQTRTGDIIRKYGNPTLAALTSGGDVNQYSINQGIADSQLKSNYLTHTQWSKYLDELEACKGGESCIQNTNDRYINLSLVNKEAMWACREGAECRAHIDAMEQVLADSALLERALRVNDKGLIRRQIFEIEKGDLTFGGAARKFGFDQVRSDLRIDDYPEWRAENCAAIDSVACLAGYNDANMDKLSWEGITGPVMRQVEAPMAALSCVSGNLSLEACNNVLVMAGAEVIIRGAGEIVVDLGGQVTRILRRADGKTTSEIVEETTNIASVGGKTCVYSCVIDGTTRYVGITDDIARRGAEHLRKKGIEIEEIAGLDNLSRVDAHAVEQTLISYYGLEKNGGDLLNILNSISPTRNPTKYEQALIRGKELLDSVDYQWTK